MSDEMVQFWFDFMIEHGVHERILKSMEESKWTNYNSLK